MQFLKLPYELITDTNITSNEFRVYTYLLSRHNEEKGCAYPSIEVIAENTNIGITTVKNSIKNLAKLGYMVIEKRKGLNGNYNAYKEMKHLVTGVVKVEKKEPTKPVKEEVKPVTPVPVAPASKEEVVEVSEYSMEHQAKISLVLKNVKDLTEKQMALVVEMDLEILRKSLYRFKKQSKTKTFAFLVQCYYTECSLSGEVKPSMDLQRYCKTPFIPAPQREEEVESEVNEATTYNVEGFNNFEPRSYDYNDLEERLLGWK